MKSEDSELAKAKIERITKKAIKLDRMDWAYLVGMLEGRLEKMKNDRVAKRIKNQILKQYPLLKRLLNL